jgi:hypothetical protein
MRIGFIIDAEILNNQVPAQFIEAKGTFKEYLLEWNIKEDKALILLGRGTVHYQPSELEQNVFGEYFGIDNKVDYDVELTKFKQNEINSNDITDII